MRYADYRRVQTCLKSNWVLVSWAYSAGLFWSLPALLNHCTANWKFKSLSTLQYWERLKWGPWNSTTTLDVTSNTGITETERTLRTWNRRAWQESHVRLTTAKVCGTIKAQRLLVKVTEYGWRTVRNNPHGLSRCRTAGLIIKAIFEKTSIYSTEGSWSPSMHTEPNKRNRKISVMDAPSIGVQLRSFQSARFKH